MVAFRCRAPLLSVVLVSALAFSTAFVAPSRFAAGVASSSPRRSRSSALAATASRRHFVERSVIAAAAATLPPLPSHARDAPAPVTRQSVTEAFDAVRAELSSPTGVVATLRSLIDGGSYPEILEYTKEQDAYFRKAKLGRARKLLTDKELKGESVLMSNAVTWDLIGINRASRPGKEDRGEQLRYLEELKDDIEKFLTLEETIDIVDE